MAKEDLIETTATVTEVLPDARYRVKLDNGYELIAYTNGKMRKHHIRILAGDKVFAGNLSVRHDQRSYYLPSYRGSSSGCRCRRKTQVIASVKEAVAKLEFCVSLFSFVRYVLAVDISYFYSATTSIV